MATPLKNVMIRETSIALLINLIVGGYMTLRTLPKQDFLPLLGGPESAGFGLFPASILFPLFATLIVTTVIKKQNAAGKINLNGEKISSRLPKNTLRLGLTLAFFGVLATCLTLFLAKVLYGSQWAYDHALILNIAYLIAVTLVVIPLVVRCAVRT